MKFFLLLSLIFFIAFSGSASAYFDPGTGSVILQLLLAGVGGVLVVAKVYWTRLKSVFDADRSKKRSTFSNDAD